MVAVSRGNRETLRRVDFLMECIGFPPDQDLSRLADLARERGERVPWRGPGGEHLRVSLGGGLGVRLDREEGRFVWSLTPDYRSAQRLRVALDAVSLSADSPSDAFVAGWANPLPREDPSTPSPDSYPVRALLSDARRLPRTLERGHVIAMALAGFALDVSYIGPDSGAREPWVAGLPHGAAILPLDGAQQPAACLEVSLRILRVQSLTNPLTDRRVDLVEVETPGRSLPFFVSPWQLAADRLTLPRPGLRIEGTFFMCGRIVGGLGSPSQRLGGAFG